MRYESAITTLSWIPSEAVRGLAKAPFSVGLTHYDVAPPDELGPDVAGTLAELRSADRLRFAQQLRAWIEVDDHGRIVDAGSSGSSVIGSTTVRLGPAGVAVAAHALPDLEPEPDIDERSVRFRRTAGGRTGVPAPRTVRHPPFLQLRAPIAWTTVEITLHADGRAESVLAGASPFPRHWVFDADGVLVAKSGLTRFSRWWTRAFGARTPWGAEDDPALVVPVETQLERALSSEVMAGARPEVSRVRAGDALCTQGEADDRLYLVLDGVLVVVVDGTELAEVGPGAVLGERAVLEGGRRTSTVRAVTDVVVAAAPSDRIDRERLGLLAGGHRREGTDG